MKKVRIFILVGLPVALLLLSCLDNFNRNLETVYYNPSYSIPIGPLDYTLGDIMPPLAIKIPIPDTTDISDTIPLLIYNDSLFFVNPEFGYDTSFIEPVNLAEISNLSEYIVSLMLRANISNNIPTDMALQIYFLNGANEVMDSLYQDGKVIVEGPEIDENGQIVGPHQVTIDTYIENEDINTLLQISAIEIYIFLQTYTEDLEILHVNSESGLGLQLGFRAELLAPI